MSSLTDFLNGSRYEEKIALAAAARAAVESRKAAQAEVYRRNRLARRKAYVDEVVSRWRRRDNSFSVSDHELANKIMATAKFHRLSSLDGLNNECVNDQSRQERQGVVLSD